MQYFLKTIVTRMEHVCQLPINAISWLFILFTIATWNDSSVVVVASEPALYFAECQDDSQPQEATPERAANLPTGINDGFLNPEMDPEEYIKRFEVESREVFACRHEILNALELKAGNRVGDIGAGTGLFMKSLSQHVGNDGRVYAVEIAPSFVKHLRSRAKTEGLENVEVIFCSDRHANLPKNSVDRLFLCDVYHHFEFPQATMDSLYQAMSDGGMLVLVDFHREPKDVSPERAEWLKGHIRAPQDVFRSEIEKSGFQFKDEITIDGFQENYLLRFIKAESGKAAR